MTRSDQLRQVLYHFDEHIFDFDELALLADAARCWLRLQEADEQMVEKVADVLRGWDPFAAEDRARAVIAAIVGEET